MQFIQIQNFVDEDFEFSKTKKPCTERTLLVLDKILCTLDNTMHVSGYIAMLLMHLCK
jgi:hypothetical protein